MAFWGEHPWRETGEATRVFAHGGWWGWPCFCLSGRQLPPMNRRLRSKPARSQIFIGESVDYVVEIRNAKSPATPDLTRLKGSFDVVANGDESRNQSSTYIINGRITQQSTLSHVYRYRLTPKRTGKLVIPAPSATFDGKTISGLAVEFSVIAAEEQDVVIPEVKTDRARVYPTQPFEVTLRVLVRPLEDDTNRDPLTPLRRNPPNINVNWVDLPAGLSGQEKPEWLQKILAENGVGFTLNDITMRTGSFFDGRRRRFSAWCRGGNTESVTARMSIISSTSQRKVIPEKAGMYTLGPGVVKGSFVDGMDGGRYVGRRLVAIAAAVPVEVAKSRARGRRHFAAESATTAWQPLPALLRCGLGTRSRYGLTSSEERAAARST